MNIITAIWPLYLLIFTVFFNEFLIYYFKIGATCSWPEVRDETDSLQAFMIADTHLLGAYRGYWLDKLKREWQMRRAFRSASWLLSPEVIFFLGDLLDEGKWSNEKIFKGYAGEFKKLFESEIPVHVLPGNHDLGFHYELNPHVVYWFKENFNRSLVDSVTIKNYHFIFVNSMAFHGDGCFLCHNAELELENISAKLNCSKHSECADFSPYSRPIVLLHFPFNRADDSVCLRDREFDYDAPKRDELYRPRWESLSEEATTKIIKELSPRAVFNGHSHRDCKRRWVRPVDFWEYTVNSFSWRNGDRPTFLMVKITPSEVTVRTCFLPNESTTIILYIIAVLITFIVFSVRIYSHCRGRSRRRASFSLLPDSKERKTD